MENDTQKIVCTVCGSSEIKYFTKKNGFDLYECEECSLLFVFPIPRSEDVYDNSYFNGAEKGFGYVDYDADKEPMISTFEKYIRLMRENGIYSGELLDIGAATGFFMSLAKKNGYSVTGVELSDFAAEKGRQKGLNIITGDVFSHTFPSESFDVVTMFDVLEHVPNPKEVLAEVRRILKPKGLLLVNTPDAESLWAKMLGKNWQLIVPPEHINYFSPQSLSRYLTKHGFDVRISTKIGKKFTLQYVFKTLYKWQKLRIFLLGPKLNALFSRISIPINLRDNFFMVLIKND